MRQRSDWLHSNCSCCCCFHFILSPIFINLLRWFVREINQFLKKFWRHNQRLQIAHNDWAKRRKKKHKGQCKRYTKHYAQYDNKSTASLHKRCTYRLSAVNLSIFSVVPSVLLSLFTWIAKNKRVKSFSFLVNMHRNQLLPTPPDTSWEVHAN